MHADRSRNFFFIKLAKNIESILKYKTSSIRIFRRRRKPFIGISFLTVEQIALFNVQSSTVTA